jgi:hypothetical protein
MSDATQQPPAKKEVALALLEGSSMFVHLDPRRPDVSVPKWFVGQPQLILQVGLNMAIPIPDLEVDDTGITCTLSFNRSPFLCRIPWTAIYALVGEDGRGGVWAEDVPPEIRIQKKARPSKAATPRKLRPTLASVPTADTDREAELGRDDTSAQYDEGADRMAEAHGMPEPADPPEREDAEPESVLPIAQEKAPDELAGRPDLPASAPPGKKPRREIPPYLRVIK